MDDITFVGLDVHKATVAVDVGTGAPPALLLKNLLAMPDPALPVAEALLCRPDMLERA